MSDYAADRANLIEQHQVNTGPTGSETDVMCDEKKYTKDGIDPEGQQDNYYDECK